MSSAKRTAKVKKVNTNQPSFLLRQKQTARIRALLAEKKRQNQMRKEFENFMKKYQIPENNNNYTGVLWNNAKKRVNKTRRLRR